MADLPINRQPGDRVLASDLNAIAKAVNALQALVAALPTGGSSSGGFSPSLVGFVLLDTFGTSTSTDSDKLDAAIAYCKTLAPYYPVIMMSARKYVFTRSIGQPFNGFSLQGAGRGQLSAVSTSKPNYHTTVQAEIPRFATGKPGYFINVADGSTGWDWYIAGINWYSDNGFTQFMRAFGGLNSQIRECTFHDMTFQNFYSVFGNSGEYIAATICNWTGGWSIFNSRSTSINLGGSDNRAIFSEGLDIYNDSTFPGNAQWMIMFSSLGKSNVGPIYITAYGGWRGLKINNSQSSGSGLIISGAVIEGNNAGEPCDGSLVRVEGSGNVIFRDITIDCGMKNPAVTASANGGTADRGLVEVMGTGGVVFDGINFDHATGVAITTPCIYVSGTPEVRISNVQKSSRGGTAWGNQQPVVSGAISRVLDNDSSVVLVA